MSEPKVVVSSTSTEDDLGHGGDGTVSGSFLYGILNEIISSPLNVALVGVIVFLLYKITRSRQQPTSLPPPLPELPRLRRDFTVAELMQYNGVEHDGRVLVAVNGNVYDATKGKKFYGPGGPYAIFCGRDASRGLATFSVTASPSDAYDDLSDLNSHEMESVREWEMQFKEKYILVGRLLKPGEQPTNYSDEDEDTSNEIGSSAIKKRAIVGDAVATLVASVRDVESDKMVEPAAVSTAMTTEDSKHKAE